MMTANTFRTNEPGFVSFQHRDFSKRGDKGTWARLEEDGSITLQKAARGLISDAYEAELREFCASFGADFDAIRCGERVSMK